MLSARKETTIGCKNYTQTWAFAYFLATREEIKTSIDDENIQTNEQQD